MTNILYLEFDGLPPTVNSMYRNSGSRRYKKQVIADWQDDVAEMLQNRYSANQTLTENKEKSTLTDPYRGKVAVDIVFTVSDRRRWDIDNRLKALLDCLTIAFVIEDDSQIEKISASRHRGEKNMTKLTLSAIS